MSNTEQTIIMAEIRQIKKHQEEQDIKIANLELKENINGATILKAISELAKETRKNYKELHEDNKSIHKELKELREDNKSLHEDNKSIHKELKELREDNKSLHEDNKSIHEELKELHEDNKSLHEDNKSIHEELQKVNNKLDVLFEILSKRV